MSNDHVLRTARPPKAVIAWATADAIFFEVPHKEGGPPFVVRERRSLEGLARALNVMIEHAEAPLRRDPNEGNGSIQKLPIGVANAVTGKPVKQTATWATDEQRERTRELLRKMGKI